MAELTRQSLEPLRDYWHARSFIFVSFIQTFKCQSRELGGDYRIPISCQFVDVIFETIFHTVFDIMICKVSFSAVAVAFKTLNTADNQLNQNYSKRVDIAFVAVNDDIVIIERASVTWSSDLFLP